MVNRHSAMKVNTDGVLLGVLMTISPDARKALDVGTGTGTIALMAAQRLADMHSSGTLSVRTGGDDCGLTSSGCHIITAIDVDQASAEEAAANFETSPWKESLTALHISLDDFARTCGDRFDLIFSNPPYFDDSLAAPEQRRNNARHTGSGLSYRELLEFSSERLTEDGRFAIVLPADQERALTRHARMCGLHLHRITRVRTVPRKLPGRIVAEFARPRCTTPHETLLTIQNEGKYTQEYLSLMHDFYLFA